MYDRQKVLQTARNEIGYLEKSKAAYLANPAILDQKTAGAGSDNYTKYGRDMHKVYPAVMDFPAPWCDSFNDWCFYRSYGVATAKSLLGGNFDDYTVASANAFRKFDALDHKPEVGAQIFYSRNGQISGIYHTGIVENVSADGKTITTIEGNTSGGAGIVANGGGVFRKTRKLDTRTMFFGHPNYQDGYKNTSGNHTAQAAGSSILKVGSKGNAVVAMQNMLIDCGYPCGESGADGVFGTDTYVALTKFQKISGLTVDGEYGPKSRAALQTAFNAIKSRKSIDTIAREVIAQKWGNGQDRVNRLEKAGYDPTQIQRRVNELLRG